MDEITINIYPILEFIIILLAVVGAFWTINSLTQIALNNKKDIHIADKFSEKFPLVNPEFYKKTKIEQLVENNQEIHETNKRLDSQNIRITQIEANQQTILEILEELQNKNG